MNGNVKKMSRFDSYIPKLVLLWQHYETLYEENQDKKHSDAKKKIKIGRSETQ